MTAVSMRGAWRLLPFAHWVEPLYSPQPLPWSQPHCKAFSSQAPIPMSARRSSRRGCSRISMPTIGSRCRPGPSRRPTPRPCAGSPKFPRTASCPRPMCCPSAMAPHEAARRAGIAIDMAKLVPPATDRLLVVEGAGGMLVPLTDTAYVIDLASELAAARDPRRPLDARHHQPHAAVDRGHAPPRPAACRRGHERTRDAA